jgi:hypothetical protein
MRDFLLARGLATGVLLDISRGKERRPCVWITEHMASIGCELDNK